MRQLNKSCLATIFLGEGEHIVRGFYSRIKCSVKILAESDALLKRVVLSFMKSLMVMFIWLDQLTLRQSKYSGVVGYSSFTLNDLIIEQCGYDDVSAYGSFAVARL